MIPLGTVFRSGTNHSGEIEGTLRAGFQVGVSVCELNVEAVRTLRDCAQAHPERMLFVDSGAFGEVGWSEAEGRLVVREPIDSGEWCHRLRLYEELAQAWGHRCLLVCPDLVGDQAGTLARLKGHGARMQRMADRWGAWLILPVQRGALSMTEFAAQAYAALDRHPRVVWGIPSKKAATSPAELSAFAQSFAEAGHPAPWFHLLGAVPEMALWPGRRYLDLLVAVRRHLPDAMVTCDSVRLRALVGRNKGRGDKPRPLTAAQDAARAQGLTGARAVKRAAVQAVYGAERAHLEAEGTALLKRIAGLEDELARAPRQFDFGFTPTRRSA